MADREDRTFQPTAAGGANVDPKKLGQRDTPEEDWGDPADPDAQHGANHEARAARAEPDRGKGAKTRAAFKDQVSRRA